MGVSLHMQYIYNFKYLFSSIKYKLYFRPKYMQNKIIIKTWCSVHETLERGRIVNDDGTGTLLSLAPRQRLASGVPTAKRGRETDR